MWVPRLSRLGMRLAAPGGWSITKSCAQHRAGVSAGWMMYSEAPGRTCILQSSRLYGARVPDEESSDRPDEEALPEFNINVLVNLLRQENGKDLCVIRIPPETNYVDYFVIVGGTSHRHLRAMAQYLLKMLSAEQKNQVEEKQYTSLDEEQLLHAPFHFRTHSGWTFSAAHKFLKGENERFVCLQGKDADDWLCIDFGNIIVHFMLPETREAFELEKLWTLRSHDDQLSQIPQEILPSDFMFGLEQHEK